MTAPSPPYFGSPNHALFAGSLVAAVSMIHERTTVEYTVDLITDKDGNYTNTSS